MGNPPFEDVSPTKTGGFPIAMLIYQRVNITFNTCNLLGSKVPAVKFPRSFSPPQHHSEGHWRGVLCISTRILPRRPQANMILGQPGCIPVILEILFEQKEKPACTWMFQEVGKW